MMDEKLTLLNELTPSQFLRDYWQKKPLLIKHAMPNFAGFLSPDELAGLACEEGVESRIIQHQDNKWQLQHGPFDDETFAQLPDKDWTLLVQSVNHYLPEAEALLKQFNFIPHARLDDLMVSYAPNGGSVGPHLDSYDVFLLQGAGKREWQISTQTQHDWLASAPIKVLSNFKAEERFVLEAGDMLYLPPQVAHWGTALDDECMTYSIGFRAPNTEELSHAFLDFLSEKVFDKKLYTDPNLSLQVNPAEISTDMINQVSSMLASIEWHNDTVAQFLGQYLSEPKQHILFTPNEEMSLSAFAMRLKQSPIYLSLASQMLFWQNQFYLNGEVLAADETLQTALIDLANTREVQADSDTADKLAKCLHHHYLAGYCEFRE